MELLNGRTNPIFVLEKNNVDSHRTRSLEILYTNTSLKLGPDFNLYANPPQFPTFQLLRMFWRILKQRIKNRKPRTQEVLKATILKGWNRIEQSEINKLVLTMMNRT